MPSNEKLPGRLGEQRSRGDGFQSPGEGYFARLAERASEAARKPETRRRSLPVLRYWQTAAAALILVLAATWLLRDPNSPGEDPAMVQNHYPSSEELLAEISPAAIEAYISDELEVFTPELYNSEPDNQ